MKKISVAIIVSAIVAVGWFLSASSPFDASDTSRVAFSVEQGWSTHRIASALSEKHLIRSPLLFRLHVRRKGYDGMLQAGKFILSPSMSVAEIAESLLKGRAEEISITIPEGFTVLDIDVLLHSYDLMMSGSVLHCANYCDFSTYTFLPNEGRSYVSDPGELTPRGGILEGYLFPDTYYVNPNEFSAKFFLERMLNAFRKNVVEDEAEALKTSGRSLHDLITMASLIEEETKKDDERGMVSGILWKRFDDGRGLGVDATVRYILNKPTEGIYHADLNTNSPYNTRKFRGLPPGPIASPGIKSIRAALYPEDSPYWYYLHAPDGQIHYARTNTEHNLNRMEYLNKGE